jgi:hypothetical protein
MVSQQVRGQTGSWVCLQVANVPNALVYSNVRGTPPIYEVLQMAFQEESTDSQKVINPSRVINGITVGLVQEAKGLAEHTSNLISNVITSFPHYKPHGHIFRSKNSHYTLTILANHKFGLPYGILPRLIFASIINEVQETKLSVLNVTTMYSKLLCNIKKLRCTDRHDSEKCLYDQFLRFFSSDISCSYKNENHKQCADKMLIDHAIDFWRIPLKGRKESILSHTKIVLTKDFYNELINFPVLINFQMISEIYNDGLILKPYQSNMAINDLIDEGLI